MTHPQDPFEALMAANFEEEVPTPPDIDSQKAFLEHKKAALTAQLTENGTFVRIFDSLPSDKQFGENWNVSFKLNGNDELYARVELSNIETIENNTHKVKTDVLFIDITKTNDVGEHPPVGRFDDSDSSILYRHFNGLDADKQAGLLPNLDGQYEIFNPNTAMMMLGKDTTARAIEPPIDTED